MDYRRFGDCYYVRADKGDEIISSILDVCERESIRSATFSGIGGCSDAEIMVLEPELGVFNTQRVEGMLELVSVMGNVIEGDDGRPSYHAHALFSYHEDGQQRIAAGHLASSTVRYTAEIELRPVMGGAIGSLHNPETNTDFWSFGS